MSSTYFDALGYLDFGMCLLECFLGLRHVAPEHVAESSVMVVTGGFQSFAVVHCLLLWAYTHMAGEIAGGLVTMIATTIGRGVGDGFEAYSRTGHHHFTADCTLHVLIQGGHVCFLNELVWV